MRNIEEYLQGGFAAMAAGDAMGVPSSFYTQAAIKREFGWIDSFYPPKPGHIFHDGLKAGEYTDDTEQSMALLNAFSQDGRVVPKHVVREIVAWAERVKDKYASPLGPSTERALKSIAAGGDITQTGRWGNTNGSAMRIAPLGLIHGLLDTTLEELARDVALTDLATHNTRVCNASAAAIAWGVALCLRGEKNLDIILQEMCKAADEGGRYGYSIPSPSISQRIQLACDLTRKGDTVTVMERINACFGGGDLAADSIPTAAAIFRLGEGNVKETIEIAVNIGGDCDTNGAMVGAMVGAMNGISAVPVPWVETLERVNGCHFQSQARQLQETATHWQVATAADTAFLLMED